MPPQLTLLNSFAIFEFKLTKRILLCQVTFLWYERNMQKKINPKNQISVKFPDEQYSAILLICEAEDRSQAAVVKLLVKEALACRASKVAP